MQETSPHLTNQNAILSAIRRNPFKRLAVQAIIRETGLSKDIVHDNLRNLKLKGTLATYKMGREAYYGLTQN